MPKNNSIRTIVAIVFIGIITLFSIGTIFSKKRDFSEQEKRQLAKLPGSPHDMAALKDWSKSMDTYLNDHFFGRETLVLINALPRVLFLHKSPSNMVLVGEDGWYFYVGEWVLHDYLGNFDTQISDLKDWENLITLRQDRLVKRGTNYLVAVAPNKESVYPEFLPAQLQGIHGTTMLEAFSRYMRNSRATEHFLDLSDSLCQAKAKGQVYFKTDTHWNARGAYAAYRAIMDRLQRWYPEIRPLAEDAFDKTPETKGTSGDLVGMMGLRTAILEKGEAWNCKNTCTAQKDKIISPKKLPAGSNLYTNGCPNGIPLRLLVISDSFGSALREYLSASFQEVVYSTELTLPDLELFLDQYQPHIVLDLRVGRYLPRVMSPGENETWQ